MLGSDFAFREKQGKDLVSENFFQIFEPNSRGDLKKTFFRETAVGNQDMAVGVKSQKVSKGLDGDGCSWGGIFSGHAILIIDFQRFPDTTTEF